jgi:hypothetical protein
MLDSGIDLDLDRVAQNIDEADVITIYFPLLGKTLIMDARCNDSAGPMISLVPIARDSIDRYRSFRLLRPQFDRPESISMIPWTNRVDSLARMGVWPRILARLETLLGNDRDLQERADACLCELGQLEIREMLRAVSGDQYHTLWASTAIDRN